MTREQYERLSAPFRGAGCVRLLRLVNRALTWGCYLIYPALLLWLALQRDGRFLRALLVPALGFFLLTVVRTRLNAPRPYQLLGITPLIPKDTQGKSMPSRHIFCVFMIAGTWYWIVPWVGLLLAALGLLMALIRVIAGIHFPRDGLVGAAVGIVLSGLGYF